jgi:hypothetical protein
MLGLRKYLHKVSLSAGIMTAWLFLCGIDRSPKDAKFGLQDLQSSNLLQSMPPLSEIPLSFYLSAAALVGSVVGGIFLVRYLQKKKIHEDLEKIAEDQAQLAVDSEFESRQVDDEDRDFLIELCGTSEPAELLPVIMFVEKYEQKVADYKKSTKISKADLNKIFMLRKSLQFSFKNTDVNFSSTQMIEVGTQLEFQIRHEQKKIVFTSTIIDSNETQLLIKPPTVKRRPANIRQFKELYCNIRRGNDADYEFKFEIIGQLKKDLNAVILSHTNKIRKLQIRISERLPMELEMDFQLLSSEQFEMEQKFDLGRLQHHKLSGIIKDLSAGGLKVHLDELPPQGINKSDVFLFHLPYASLRENLVASVLDVNPRRGQVDVHFFFRDIDMLTRMKLNQYLHRRKLSMEAA